MSQPDQERLAALRVELERASGNRHRVTSPDLRVMVNATIDSLLDRWLTLTKERP